MDIIELNLQDSVCFNGASCIAYCDELDAVTNTPVYTCSCLEGFEGRNCSTEVNPTTITKTKSLDLSSNQQKLAQIVENWSRANAKMPISFEI